MIEIYGVEESKSVSSLKEVIAASMRWHFSEETGSDFWISKKKELGFNPIRDIQVLEDFRYFKDYSEEMKTVNVNALIPKGIRKLSDDINVYESGGTTGSPQRIIDQFSRAKALEWVDLHLTERGITPDLDGDWLHVGPTGPHIVGTSIGRLAKRRKRLCYYIDFDPRWVKVAAKNGKQDIIELYLEHIMTQVKVLLETQNISVMFATPLVLEAISKKPELCELLNKKVKGIIWAGTSLNEDTLDAFEQYIFPNIHFAGLYGNTLMGIAPQRRKSASDSHLCVYQGFYPFSITDIVDENDPNLNVEYGKKGQVKITLMTPDLFIPWHLERDQAIRVEPVEGYQSHGVAEVQPIGKMKNTIFEGVY
ncbi:hypothetical protein KIH86_25300 [Paenibacillus sp. HN-1]|uniref:hypothetical protein n=1 Tax=Paenibacillus TaxID=44249 RepID=UPI001CA7E1E6|nr:MULTISPECIES: hypothetical protein [Paenibacillus]MBY9077384.1 hypothetical protein [Paenibacillus sp. CGMCC 1.18879]MBY9087508.1 hypothetical protein [Paenibacillus sinensis]